MKLSSFLAYINNICFESVGEALVQCDAGGQSRTDGQLGLAANV